VIAVQEQEAFLNAVTIAHSGISLITEQLAGQFVDLSCGAMLNLNIRYDKCALVKSSHNYTTFQLLSGALQLITLPMGWTYSVSICHHDVTHILQPEVPHLIFLYINDVPINMMMACSFIV